MRSSAIWMPLLKPPSLLSGVDEREQGSNVLVVDWTAVRAAGEGGDDLTSAVRRALGAGENTIAAR
jgi:hypothetical protein